jgi:CheY-like chemotaxis protein
MSRIVLVDDNVVTLKRWESLLVPLGHEVLSFSAAEAALQVLSVHPASLVVLDLAMPIHSGYDLMSTLQTQSIEIPILVVSGKNQQQDITKALRLGAVDYVMKPFDDDIFVSKVQMLLGADANLAHLDFAESVVQEPLQMQQVVGSFKISELGFYFDSPYLIPKNTALHFQSPSLKAMGLVDTALRVANVTEKTTATGRVFQVFVSFIGLNQTQLKEVRLWIRQNQLQYRRPA